MHVLTRREGRPRELAERIARKVFELGSRDPRDAVKLSRLAATKEDVDKLVSMLKTYR